jgi:hypothetical protein
MHKHQRIRPIILAATFICSLSACHAPGLRKGGKPSCRAASFALSQLRRNLDLIPPGRFPIRTKGQAAWELTPPSTWTSGFYPGCLWMAYRLSGDSSWIGPARIKTDELKEQQFNTGTHDVGFMMMSSYGQALLLNPDEEDKRILLQSARSLASRFNRKAGCLQSWNGDFQVIIDNMMNLELLFWAYRQGGGPDLREIAVSHADQTIKNHLREDGGSFHVVVYDTATGLVKERRTAQGYTAGSTWARGQAWGIYGFTMCFRETGDSLYLKTALRMADYFLDHLPEDHVPFWDFNLPADHPRRVRDASAAAIASSALLELKKYAGNPEPYDRAADGMMAALIDRYLSKGTGSSGILLHAAYNANSRDPDDWDASTIWGDYYFLEALYRYLHRTGPFGIRPDPAVM